MKTGKAILGIVAAASVGALLGILLAPQKGKDARRKIEKTGMKYAENIKEKFDAALEGITEGYNKIKEDLAEFVQQTRVKGES